MGLLCLRIQFLQSLRFLPINKQLSSLYGLFLALLVVLGTWFLTAGNAFIPQTTQNILVRLEPATNIVTEWEISSNSSSNAAPTGIAFDPTTGSVYFTESGTDIIGRVEPGRGMITKWEVGSKPQALGVTPASSVFYIDELGRIARLGWCPPLEANVLHLLRKWNQLLLANSALILLLKVGDKCEFTNNRCGRFHNNRFCFSWYKCQSTDKW